MKIKSSAEGVILLLSREEAQEIIRIINQPNLFDDPIIASDPYKRLRPRTRAFLEELHDTFPKEWIEWENPLFNTIRRKHFAQDAGTIIHRLSNEKLVEIITKGDRKHIAKFRFLF